MKYRIFERLMIISHKINKIIWEKYRLEWINETKKCLVCFVPEWEDDSAFDYAVELFDSYGNDSEYPYSPMSAVTEESSYWD